VAFVQNVVFLFLYMHRAGLQLRQAITGQAEISNS